MSALRIATYNFLSGGSATRAGHWTRMLRRAPGPAVICTQEARPPGNKLRAGDALFWRPVPGYRWGTGILIRNLPAMEVAVLGFEGWVIGAELQLDRTTRIFSVHCPAGDGGYVRTMHALLDSIAPAQGDVDVVIAGDFNVAAGLRPPNDSVKMSRAERDLLFRIDRELDLVPCWQSMHPNKRLAQTLRWTANRAAPYHCDGIFIPRSWQPRLIACNVISGPEWNALSDHNPVIARIGSSPNTERVPLETM